MDYIQLGMLIVMIAGFIVSYLLMKKDNRKANEETFDKNLNNALYNQKQYLELRNELEIVKQRINYLERDIKSNHEIMSQKFEEIKLTLIEISKKIEKHLTEH